MIQSVRNQHNNFMANNATRILAVVLVALVGFTGFGGFKYNNLVKSNTDLHNQITSKNTEIENIQFEKATLSDALTAEQEKNEEFEDQIDDLTKKVGGLVKLSKIDEELLQKYSKVYFLSENYVPQRLSRINSEYALPEDKEMYFLSQAMPFLRNMLDDAEEENLSIKIASAYRSFGTQADLKSNYKVTYGAGANQFSADQGYSEHQLATAVDFTTPSINGTLTGFEKTPEYTWLLENAHKYGFVLSYPPDNNYYIFEPWHWRFIGEDLATDLRKDGKHFFDLDQRELDKYLAKIFDN